MTLEDAITNNERLVYAIMKRYEHYFDKEDLYQVGMIGLITAYKNFNPNFNVKFSTYAFTYILGEIKRYVREDRSIKVSKDTLKINMLVDKTKELLSQKLMREPTLTEISLFLQIDEEKLQEAKMATDYVRSLDFCLNDEGNELNLYDSIKQEEKNYNEGIIDLRQQLSNLSEDEKRLIISRYYEDKTQSETSSELGISQVQVSRKEQKILTKLKNNLTA